MNQRMMIAPALFVFSGMLPLESASATPRRQGRIELESKARAVISQHCGSCHDGALSTAKPAALKVFDLREEDWTAKMSDDQLTKVTGRIKGFEVPEDQRKLVIDFVQSKLQRRASSAKR